MFSLLTPYAILCVENQVYVGFSTCTQQNRQPESVQNDIQCLQCENPAKPGLLNWGQLKKLIPNTW